MTAVAPQQESVIHGTMDSRDHACGQGAT